MLGNVILTKIVCWEEEEEEEEQLQIRLLAGIFAIYWVVSVGGSGWEVGIKNVLY